MYYTYRLPSIFFKKIKKWSTDETKLILIVFWQVKS